MLQGIVVDDSKWTQEERRSLLNEGKKQGKSYVEMLRSKKALSKWGTMLTATADIYRPLKQWKSANGLQYGEGACGCSQGKYICQSFDVDSAGSGPRVFTTSNQNERITGKDKDGNLEFTNISKGKGGSTFGGVGSVPERRNTWVAKKISPNDANR